MNKNDHIAFQVSDLEKSINFFSNKLNINLLFKEINAEENEAYAFLELEGANLEIIQKLDENFEKSIIKPPFCPHLAIETKNMDVTIKYFMKNKIPIIKGPLEEKGKVKWVYIADPDNNIIEYIEWISKK